MTPRNHGDTSGTNRYSSAVLMTLLLISILLPSLAGPGMTEAAESTTAHAIVARRLGDYTIISLVDPLTGGEREIAREPFETLPLPMFRRFVTMSPDGQYATYVTADDLGMGNARMWLISTKTGERQALGTFADELWIAPLTWSPDSTRIAFAKASTAAMSGIELWSVDVPSRRQTVVASGPSFRAALFYGVPRDVVRWSADGSSIVYTDYTAQDGIKTEYEVNLESGAIQSSRSPLTTGEMDQASLGASLPCGVTLFSQLDQEWSGDIMQSCGYTIGESGCAVTSVAMVFRYYGVETSPRTLNQCLGSSACPMLWGDASSNCSGGKVGWSGSPGFSWSTMESELAAGRPPILKLTSSWDHFVVVVSGSGSSMGGYTINDPWDGGVKSLSAYSEWSLNSLRLYSGTPWCAGETHLECRNNQCVAVDGAGSDQCLPEGSWCGTCPQSGGVILYWNNNHNCDNGEGDLGYRQRTSTGWENISGAFNDQASSVMVPSGWSVMVYEDANKSGGKKCFNYSDSDFANNAFDNAQGVNDKVSSFEVFNNSSCDSTPQDTTPPTGRITSPSSGWATNSCPFTIYADASDDLSGVDRVEFHVRYDGVWHHIGDDTTSPYSISWDCSSVSDQTVALTIHVRDKAGLETEDPGGYVDITLDRQDPSGTITSPEQGGYVKYNDVTVTASAQDSGSGVKHVGFYAWCDDGGGYRWHGIGDDSSGTDGWSVTWDASDISDQVVGFFIYIYDRALNVGSHSIGGVTLDRTGPSGGITSPSPGETIDSCPITIHADASDNLSGVDLVEFHAWYDGQWHSLGTDSTSPYGLSWNCADVSPQTVWLTIHILDKAGNETEDPGEYVDVTIPCPPVAMPVLSSPEFGTTICDDTPTFTWSAATGATTYTIQVSDSSSFLPPLELSDATSEAHYTPSSPLPTGTYFWRVWAGNSCRACSSLLSSFTLLAPPSTPDLASPTNGSTNCDGTPSFVWSAVSGATSYHLQVDKSSSFDFPLDIDTTTSNSSYVPGSALWPGTYYWRVRAHNTCGYGSWSPTWTFAVNSLPLAPNYLSPGDGSHTADTTPDFWWSYPTGSASSYRIQLDDDPSFGSPEIDDTASDTHYLPGTPLSPGEYHWRVMALNSCGQSAWSDTTSLTIVSPSAGCAPAHTLTCGGSHYWNNGAAGSTDQIDAYVCEQWDESGPEYAYTFLPYASGQVTITVDFDWYWHGENLWLDLFVLDGEGAVCNAANCLAAGIFTEDDVEVASFTAQAWHTYYLVVDGQSGQAADYFISVECMGQPDPGGRNLFPLVMKNS